MFSGDHCVLNLLPRDTLKDDDYDLIVLQTKYMMVFSATLLAMQTGTDDAGSKDTLLGGIALILEFTAGPGAALPQAACDAAQKKLVDRKVRAAPRREISPPHLGHKLSPRCVDRCASHADHLREAAATTDAVQARNHRGARSERRNCCCRPQRHARVELESQDRPARGMLSLERTQHETEATFQPLR